MAKRLQKNAVVHLASVMWKHAEGSRRWIVLYLLMAVIAVLILLCIPLVIAQVMQAIQNERGDALLSSSAKYLMLFVLAALCFWLFHGPSRVIETVLAYKIRRLYQVDLFRKVTMLPMNWHKANHSGETIDQVAKATTALGDFASTSFEVVHILVRLFGAIGFLIWMMPIAGLAVFAFALVIGIAIVLFDRKLVRQYATQNKQLNEVAASVQDYLTNVGTIISLRLEDRVSREINERAMKIAPIWRTTAKTSELKWFSTSMLVDGMYAVVLFGFLFFKVRSGQTLEIGAVFALCEYLRSIADAFYRFTGSYGELLTKSSRLHGVDHIEAAYDEHVKASIGATLPKSWKKIEIKNLTFSHDDPSAERRVSGLRDVSLTLERGKSYALVGESGSGKSTLLKLLRGLHHAQSGRVVCDGIEMVHGLNHVAHHATLIPQEPDIFADSIRFNVAMGVQTCDEAIYWALERAQFLRVLKRLPKGLETGIAEKGVSLSGGEKQRLAVARGLFFVKESGSDIVLLDEPTSSVDSHNERLIYQGLLAEFRSMCVVTAIHKFNLLHLFDEVLVFAGGELVQRGTVQQLLAQGGEFTRLCGNLASQERKVVSLG